MLCACYSSSIALIIILADVLESPVPRSKCYLRDTFINLAQESIRDQFVAGILNEDLVEKIELLYYSKDGFLTLDDNVKYTRMYNDIHEGRKQEKEQSKSSDEVKFLKGKKERTKTIEYKCKFREHSHLPHKCQAYWEDM
ncbi:hypothetical protein SK128_009504 [Halocaridina rubra]|uniref:Uncharacterized protein n=1 Tax=Halocaridina rubra TaxID=373956 RepID=A0AAN8X9R0_HALRR